MCVCDCKSGRTKLWENVWDRIHEAVYIQPYMKSSLRVDSTVSISYKSYGLLWDRSQALHQIPGVHTRFYTIAIRPIRFKYESYMVQYGYSRSYTASYDLTRLQSSLTRTNWSPRHGWSPILVPVNPCITDIPYGNRVILKPYFVWE